VAYGIILAPRKQLVNVSQGDNDGMTPLHWACYNGQSAVLQCHLRHGADVAVLDSTLWTALHWAVVGGSVDCFIILLDQEVPLHQIGKRGSTAYRLTREMRCHNMRQMLDQRLHPTTLSSRGRLMLEPEEQTVLECLAQVHFQHDPEGRRVRYNKLCLDVLACLGMNNAERSGKYTQAVMKLVTVFFEGVIWQPSFLTSIVDIMLLTAQDLVDILLLRAAMRRQRIKFETNKNITTKVYRNSTALSLSSADEAATECVTMLVKDTKLALAFPGKSLEIISRKILWELRRRAATGERTPLLVYGNPELAQDEFPLGLFKSVPGLSSLEAEIKSSMKSARLGW